MKRRLTDDCDKSLMSKSVPPTGKRARIALHDISDWYALGGALDSQTTETLWYNSRFGETPQSQMWDSSEFESKDSVQSSLDHPELRSKTDNTREDAEEMAELKAKRSVLMIPEYDGAGLETLMQDTFNDPVYDAVLDHERISPEPPGAVNKFNFTGSLAFARRHRDHFQGVLYNARPWLSETADAPRPIAVFDIRCEHAAWRTFDTCLNDVARGILDANGGVLPLARYCVDDTIEVSLSMERGHARLETQKYVPVLEAEAIREAGQPHNEFEREALDVIAAMHYSLSHMPTAVLRSDRGLMDELIAWQRGQLRMLEGLETVKLTYRD